MTGSIVIAAIIALTTYLQSHARWWVGPATAVMLLTTGCLLALAVAQWGDRQGYLAMFPAASLVMCAACILWGAVFAIALRHRLPRSKLASYSALSGMTAFIAFAVIY